jgi:hypothetical protein
MSNIEMFIWVPDVEGGKWLWARVLVLIFETSIIGTTKVQQTTIWGA